MTPDEHVILLMKQLKQYIKENKITQNELAEKSGVSIWTISRVFTGKSGIHLYTYIQLLDALGLDIKLAKAKDEKLD